MKPDKTLMNQTSPMPFTTSPKLFEKIKALEMDPKSESQMSLMALILESSEPFLFSVS